MMDVIFPKRGLPARKRDRDNYRRRQQTGHDDGGAHYGDEPANLLDGVGINLDRIEAELRPNRLREIAELVRTLTYGEMMQLAQELWKVRPDGPVDEHSLPMMLHLWSIPADPAPDQPATDLIPLEQ